MASILAIQASLLCLAAWAKRKEMDPILESQLVCKPGKYGLERMENRRIQNDFCMMHAARTCCDHHDANKLREQYEVLRQLSETSGQCLAMMQDAICSHCDPDMGSGVYDGMCGDYCDRLYHACADDFYDPYADAASQVPLCKNDSLLCSKVSDHVSSGAEFCKSMGFEVSQLQQPTMRLDYDCFNGQSSVGPKYDRLDIDYELVNERDFPYYDDEEDDIDPFDWDWIDENGNDIFGRIGQMLFGGSGLVAALYRGMIGPGLSFSRRLYRKYLKGIFIYIMSVFLFMLSYELFVNRKVHLPVYTACCKPQKGRGRAPQAARDIAREERIKHIQERLHKKAEEEKASKTGKQKKSEEPNASGTSSQQQKKQSNAQKKKRR